MGGRSPLAFALAVLLATLAGCGSAPVDTARKDVALPRTPSARDCGIGASAGPADANHPADDPSGADGAPKKQSPPPPGVYRYRTRGESGVPSEALRAKDLPGVTELIVTKARRLDGLTCFRMQKRYAPRLANTETYVIRGSELFLVGLRIEALGRSQEVRPEPAVLFASSSGSQWSGQFTGRTKGSYSVTGLGGRRYRVGSRELKVTGLESSVSYRGVVSGVQKTTIWFSPARRLIVSEELKMRERLGVSEVRLDLRRHLLSLAPGSRAAR
jgi:hypothetical protein